MRQKGHLSGVINEDCLYLDAVCVCLSVIILLTDVVKKQNRTKNHPKPTIAAENQPQFKNQATNKTNKTHQQKKAVAT